MSSSLCNELNKREEQMVAERAQYDRNWNWIYNNMKMRFWYGMGRSDLRPKVEYPGAYLQTLKEQGIFNQGKYSVVVVPIYSDKLSDLQRTLYQNFSSQKWVDHDMAMMALGILWDQGWASNGITKSAFDLDEDDFITELVPPETMYVSPGTKDFDRTCEYTLQKIPYTMSRLIDRFGSKIANMAEPMDTNMKRGGALQPFTPYRFGTHKDGRFDATIGGSGIQLDEALMVKEWFVRDGRRLRRITVVGDYPVDDRYFRIQRFPYIRWPASVTNEFYNVPTAQPGANINAVMNQYESFLLDYVIATTYQKTVVSKQANLDIMDLDNNPAGVWYVDGDPRAAVMSMSPNQIPGQAFGYTGHLSVMHQKATFNDEQYGRAQGANRTKGQTELLLAAGQTGVGLKASLLGMAAGKWARLQWELERAYAAYVLKRNERPAERLAAISGALESTDKIFALQEMIAENRPIRAHFDFGSRLPMTKELMEQKALMLFQQKVIGAEDLLKTWEWPGAEDIIERQKKAAEAQAAQMAQASKGAGPGAAPADLLSKLGVA